MVLSFERVEQLTADELKNFSKEQILACILLFDRYEALDGDYNNCSVFEFGFSRFLLSLNDVNDLIGRQILSLLRGGFDNVFDSIESAHGQISMDAEKEFVQSIFQLFAVLLENLHRKLDESFGLLNVEQVLLTILHFLNKTTAYNLLYSENEIKELLDVMQISLSKLLTSSNFQLHETVNELILCRRVLHELVELGRKQSAQNDVKSMANTWKHLSKLAIDYRTTHRTLQQNQANDLNSDDFLDWMTFCIQNICELISRNVHRTIEMYESNQRGSNTIEKVTKFYQKLLQSLAKEFPNDDFRGQSYFIQSYEMIADALDKCTSDGLRSYLLGVHDGFSQILNHIYNCNRFSTELLMKTSVEHIGVMLAVMKILLNSSDTSVDRFLSPDNVHGNIFHHMTTVCIPREIHRLYASNNLYEEVVQVCTMLLLTFAGNSQVVSSIEHGLVENSFTDDLHLMTIYLDIWMLYLSNISEESQFSYCKFWLNASSSSCILLRTPNEVMINILLRYTFSLLSGTKRSQIVQEIPGNDFKSLALLDMDCITNGVISKFQHHTKLVVRTISETFAKLNPSTGIVTSRECSELLSVLSSFQFPATKRLLSFLNDPDLVSYLSDALLRCKTRPLNALLSIILRMQLWQKYLCQRSSDTLSLDHFDCSEVRKFYAIESIALEKHIPVQILAETRSIFENADDLTKFRWRNALQRQNFESSCIFEDDNDHFHQLLKVKRNFGCTSNESCSNSSVIFRRLIEQIVTDSKKLDAAHAENSNVDLRPFFNEIKFISDFFNRLQYEI